MSYATAVRCRHAYQRFLALVLIVTLSADAITGQTIKKCAENNEYCQNHWDCCSNSCLSYLYRCVRSYNVYPYPFLGVTHINTVTLEDIIAQNFGPQTGEKSSSTAAPLSSNSLQGPMFASRFNDDNSIDREHTTVLVDIVLQEQKEEQPTVTTTSEMPTVSTTMEPDGDCKEIGSKCYRNSECCTQRCHGFLHQCVT